MSKTWGRDYFDGRKRRPRRRKCLTCKKHWAARDSAICQGCKTAFAAIIERQRQK